MIGPGPENLRGWGELSNRYIHLISACGTAVKNILMERTFQNSALIYETAAFFANLSRSIPKSLCLGDIPPGGRLSSFALRHRTARCQMSVCRITKEPSPFCGSPGTAIIRGPAVLFRQNSYRARRSTGRESAISETAWTQYPIARSDQAQKESELEFRTRTRCWGFDLFGSSRTAHLSRR